MVIMEGGAEEEVVMDEVVDVDEGHGQGGSPSPSPGDKRG